MLVHKKTFANENINNIQSLILVIAFQFFLVKGVPYSCYQKRILDVGCVIEQIQAIETPNIGLVSLCCCEPSNLATKYFCQFNVVNILSISYCWIFVFI